MEMTPYENKVLIPDPVDTAAIPFRRRTRAITFVHNAGRFGTHFANCTPDVLAAIPLVKNPDARFIIRSQKEILSRVDDPRVRYEGHVADYSNLYREGDIFLMPQKFRATSLPIQEAMAAGMPVMTTRMKPYDEFCAFLLQPDFTQILTGLPLRRPVLAHRVTPETIAAAIDNIVGSDIGDASCAAREYAESISWDVLTPKIVAALEGPGTQPW